MISCIFGFPKVDRYYFFPIHLSSYCGRKPEHRCPKKKPCHGVTSWQKQHHCPTFYTRTISLVKETAYNKTIQSRPTVDTKKTIQYDG